MIKINGIVPVLFHLFLWIHLPHFSALVSVFKDRAVSLLMTSHGAQPLGNLAGDQSGDDKKVRCLFLCLPPCKVILGDSVPQRKVLATLWGVVLDATLKAVLSSQLPPSRNLSLSQSVVTLSCHLWLLKYLFLTQISIHRQL